MSRIIAIKRCDDCPYRGRIGERPFCKKVIREIDQYDECEPGAGMPEWCPFPLEPAYKYGIASWIITKIMSTGKNADYWHGYIQGWNDCRSEILEEEKT